ncbi:hypothetical protein PSTT_02176, partial [Puccinia striiformis]
MLRNTRDSPFLRGLPVQVKRATQNNIKSKMYILKSIITVLMTAACGLAEKATDVTLDCEQHSPQTIPFCGEHHGGEDGYRMIGAIHPVNGQSGSNCFGQAPYTVKICCQPSKRSAGRHNNNRS